MLEPVEHLNKRIKYLNEAFERVIGWCANIPLKCAIEWLSSGIPTILYEKRKTRQIKKRIEVVKDE